MKGIIIFKFDPEQDLNTRDIYLSNISGFDQNLVSDNFIKGCEFFKDDASHIHEVDRTFSEIFKFCKAGEDPMDQNSRNFGKMSELLEE